MTYNTTSSLNVTVVVDGRPGHEKQSFGIVQALENRVPVQRTVIDISERGFWKQLLGYIQLVFPFGPIVTSNSVKPDLVIGTGTRTHTTVLQLKKRYRIPAITCMNPGRHLRGIFDVCFVPEHDGVDARDNYFFTSGAPNNCVDKNVHDKTKGLILLGGVDENSHIWDSEDIENKIQAIISRESDIDWVISSSPRTPRSTVDGLKRIAVNSLNAKFYDYKDTARGWIEKQYNACATVWVTSDSISMLYEALSSGCRVNIIKMRWKKNSSKFRRNEDLLIEKSLVTPFSTWKNGDYNLPVSTQLNEAQRCADYILQTCRLKN